MDDPNGLGDEIAIDPLVAPNIRVPRAMTAIMRRIPRDWRPLNRRRLAWLGSLAAAITAVAVVGVLKLAGVIWTSPPPKWVASLGAGVAVTGPAQVAPGHNSPGAAFAGVLATLSSKDPGAACDYALVGPVGQCRAQFNKLPRDQLPYLESVKIGYVAIDGTRALVGYTGAICTPGDTPACTTNTDPAAVFDAGYTFSWLWEQTPGPDFSHTYALLPCVEVGGKWYFGTAASASDSPSGVNPTQSL
jgi:hypothetical protein